MKRILTACLSLGAALALVGAVATLVMTPRVTPAPRPRTT